MVVEVEPAAPPMPPMGMGMGIGIIIVCDGSAAELTVDLPVVVVVDDDDEYIVLDVVIDISSMFSQEENDAE